jgi:two-component system, NtrC family, response regulator PilR
MTASAARKPAPSDPTLDGRSILIIEDHADSRDLLTTVLQSLRAHVLTARTVEEAERQLLVARPHAVICDMRLPDGTGLDFIAWLRAQSKRIRTIPCIAITGYEQHFPATAASGFNAYMRKPIDLDRFCAVVVALARG